MMYFNYRTKGIASVTSTKLRGEPAVGGSLLAVEVAVMMQPASAARPEPAKPPPIVVAILGQLTIRKVLLAPLGVEFVEWRCVDYAQANTLVLRAFLSPQQVRAVELARGADGNFELEIALTAQLAGHEGLLPAPYMQPIAMTVTASDWTRLLRDMRFEDRATFEVPIEGGRVGPPFDKAAAHMRAALDKLQMRQWDDALTSSREVLTELAPHLPAPPPALADWADKTKREAWSLLERIAAMHAAVRHVTHAGAHASIGAASEHEVRLVVTMTGALLRYVVSR